MTEAVEIRRDAIAATIHVDLQSWLEDAASTATSHEDVQDLIAGAVAGLTCFLWQQRGPGVTRAGVALALSKMALSVMHQLPDAPESVQ